MRLIDTHTLNLSEFFGSNIPKYAILSHTWGAEEVSYNEWLSRDENYLAKEGYKKIDGACKQAVKDGWDWLWVDTNCIDKSSSAELTEAINSMYQWYERSEVCYAYLIDVPSHHFPHRSLEHLRSSLWFTRGWTLQGFITVGLKGPILGGVEAKNGCSRTSWNGAKSPSHCRIVCQGFRLKLHLFALMQQD